MVRAKARMSYKDDGDPLDASDVDDYKADDSEEEFSDAPPKKKHKKSPKKAKKEKKSKKKDTDESDEDELAVEISDEETAPATWRPGGPVVEAKAATAKKSATVYKDASEHDFTDDGEIEDAADSDFDAKAPKPKTPAKKSPAKKGKKKAPAKKTPTPKKKGKADTDTDGEDKDTDGEEKDKEEDENGNDSEDAEKSPAKKGKKKTPAKKKPTPKKKGKAKKAATNGASRSSGRASEKVKYADTDTDGEDEDEDENGYDSEDVLPARVTKVAKQAKGRPERAPKKPEIPPVGDMVTTAIQGLRDNPKKGSSLAAIKGFMGEEWGINVQDYAPKIKKYILRAVENGDVLQTKGKGASGRFTLPGLKARKSKKKNYKKLGKKFDEDEVEYEPGKSARDEAKEKSEMELAEHRARLEEEAERKAAEKEMKPKKPRPEPKTDWVVIMVKGMKIAQEKTWYQVKWEGSPKLTWEPEENLTGCQELIDNFLFEEKTRLRMEEERRKREDVEGHYEVGRIIEVKFKKSGSREFMIRWKGHGAADDTWEPEENLECVELIEKFMVKHEAAVAIEEKSLRIAPKRVDRLAFSYSSRAGIRNKGGLRKTYEDMDDSDNE